MQYFIAAFFYSALFFTAVFERSAWALPLLVTDDAGIAEAKSCQIEIGHRKHAASSAAALTPACNIADQAEISLPLAWSDRTYTYAVQLKKPVIHAEHAGMAISAVYQPAQSGEPENWELNLPVSIYPSSRWQIDINIGRSQIHQNSEQMLALASSYAFSDVHQLSTEVYKADSDQHASVQVLYHYQVLPETLGLYTSYGQTLASHSSKWVGLGLSWTKAYF